MEWLIGGAVVATLVYFGVIKGSVAVPGVGTLSTPGTPAQGVPDPNFNASVAAQGRIAVGDVVSVPVTKIDTAFSETASFGPNGVDSDEALRLKALPGDVGILATLGAQASSPDGDKINVDLLITSVFPQGPGQGFKEPAAPAYIGVLVNPKLTIRLPLIGFDHDVTSVTRAGRTVAQSAA